MISEVHLESGITLEAALEKPEVTSTGSCKLAVCLHPWSWFGGQMEDPVLGIARDALISKGYHVLRYNSRGVGLSSGWASFTGFSEAQDLKDIVQWALRYLGSVDKLVIFGYSHGSLIASLHPVLSSVETHHILLSYPYGPRAWLTLFRSSTYTSALRELITNSDSNVLIIVGERDEFTSKANYDAWLSSLPTHPCDRLRIHEVEDAAHFWRGRSSRVLYEILRTSL